MSDTKSHDWSKDWEALQRQYWNAWTDLTRSQAGGAPDASTPWHEGLEQWSRMFGHAGKQSEAAERLMASAKSYLGLMQSMLSFAAGKDAGALGMPSWLEALRGGMKLPGFDAASMFGKLPGFDAASMFGKFPGFAPGALGGMPGFDPSAFNIPGFDASMLNNPFAKSLRELSAQGMRGFEQLASGAAPMLQQMQDEGVSWLKAPAFGYAREHQEHYQKMALAFVDFQQALKQYNALMLKASQRSMEILELKVAERSEPGRQIDSVRALYDLWVDAAEEAYAEIALSEEFQKVYGDVVNSQMRVRSQLQQEVERIGVDLGMPTRTELNSVHKRLHDLRRELRDSQEALRNVGNVGSDGRDAEIAAMRAEIDDLRRLVVNLDPGAAAPRPRVAAAPKKATPAPKRMRRKSAATKRAAAKRAHVAAKTTSVGMPRAMAKAPAPAPVATKTPAKPPAAAEPVTVKIVRKPAKRRPAAVRRALPRQVRPVVAGTQAVKTPAQKAAASAPVSFGDAIAAMRRDLVKPGGRKARAARQFQPFKSDSAVRARRSTP